MTQRFADICDSLILSASNPPQAVSHHGPQPPKPQQQQQQQRHSPSRKPQPPPPPQRRQSQPPVQSQHPVVLHSDTGVVGGHLSMRMVAGGDYRAGHHDVNRMWRYDIVTFQLLSRWWSGF
ncbi:hypothetical protein Btru_018782 [Bulinus truncatus]|nr:hypothetical protein Btru_018782 [Bulinus truncatus]